MEPTKNITVIGLGYVGASISVLLAQQNIVKVIDIDNKKVEMINNNVSPVEDDYIQSYLNATPLNLEAFNDISFAHKNTDFYIIATPTNYDEELQFFDTQSVDSTIRTICQADKNAVIIIKSTIPIGYVEQLRNKHPSNKIIFSPEFLREGEALYDNLYPSRIVIGCESREGKDFADLLLRAAKKDKKDIPVIFTNSNEAEAIKLFSNSYLAMRVSFFNELDSFCESNYLNTKQIIDGVCSDVRIGNHYNNPSFGYGGYCLPKDTKQLLQNFGDVPNKIISAIVEANETRKEYIANSVIQRKPKIVGVYRLVMKQGSDNFRASSILGVMDIVQSKGIKIIIFEPSLIEDTFNNFEVVQDLAYFKKISDCIISNRMTNELKNVQNKVYTRDVYGNN